MKSEDARRKAEAAGLEAADDCCMKIEHGRFVGGSGWAGVDIEVILRQAPGASGENARFASSP